MAKTKTNTAKPSAASAAGDGFTPAPPSAVAKIVLGFMVFGLVAMVLWSMAYRVSHPGLVAGGKSHGATAQGGPASGAKGPDGMSQEAMGDIAALMAKLRENPEDVDAAWQIAGRFMMAGSFDRALFFLEKVERARPTDLDVQNTLAVALHGVGRAKEAREKFERMAKEHPGDYRSLYNLGMLSKEEGDAAQAKAWLEKAAKIPGLPEDLKHQIQDELGSLGK